ncbi:VCBS repeat-containing protein [Psychroflexus sp. CAK57W]|uniref:VCBS repeat-containing protein n=1 Tax=Psychroflexus curvus TaxID=2873595 RepID=UPI001CCC7150|nr:VCBS repeat-containing protein [Psychroflexus curvus]MBZ9786347.1 VCBS repeat-containing protein [Psychroflexus curvus]
MKNLKYLSSKNNFGLVLALFFLFSCQQKEDFVFKNASSERTNISFVNQITETQDVNILDYMYFYNGGGVAIGDINNDGLPDIFFSGNQVKNKLYLNQGNLKFEDISKTANIEGNSSWNTGVVMADVNGDGFLDIYVCAVVGINGFRGHNELFINNGDGTFTESASEFGLDFDSFSSTAVFFDYDLDGDLDMYLLNHAVHTSESFGNSNLRNKRNDQTGDKLMRNDNGKFIDVSEEAGIYGGANGYGLGISVADFNQDGYPDIYVGNDFHEDDYYYINNGDGTFSNELTSYFGHTSRFTMGIDAADINHDGLSDLFTLDMLAEEEEIVKSSLDDEDYQVEKIRIKNFGYYYQYSRNMLQINQADNNFKEVGLLSGVASTDWSWSALFADFNQDGEQDLFITNGILRRPNDLDYINFVSNEQIKEKISKTNFVDNEALSKMPSGKASNYMFKGKGNLKFENTSESWISENKLTASTASAMGDLDNDGDLDLVVSNLNEEVTVLENQTNSKSNYLKIKLEYLNPNSFAIGAKVYAYYNNQLQFKENYTSRGFQSSSEPIIHFGFDTLKTIDSLKIVWPDQSFQIQKNVSTNQTIVVKPTDTQPIIYKKSKQKLFKKVEDNLGIDFTHEEDNYIDFMRQKLIPYQVSNKGPAVAIGDLDGDGKSDVFFGGSKYRTSKVFLQKDSTYEPYSFLSISKDSIKEDVSAAIADFTGNGKNDLFVGTGGADFSGTSSQLADSYYVQKEGTFKSKDLPDYFQNASVIKPFDFDNDGDLDIFVGNSTISNDFGNIPASYVLINTKGEFSLLEPNPFENAGMITDAIWSDFDDDGLTDLILVGEWMSPKFFKNSGDHFDEVDLVENLNGLWQAIHPFDIDNDGDTDYLLGNWGINTKFKASEKYPMKLYYSDFDDNGTTETIVCIEKDKSYYPVLGLDNLASQLVFLRKKFTSYKSFAGQPIENVLDKEMLDKAKVLEVNQLKSGYLENTDGNFKFIPFKTDLQVAPITTFLNFKFENNDREAILAGGNYFGLTPFHGRLDAFSGALIIDEKTIKLGSGLGIDFAKEEIRDLSIIYLKNQPFLLVTIHNARNEVYEIQINDENY